MNHIDYRDITDVKILELNRKQIKFWILLAAFGFLMLSISGNFHFQTDSFEVTLSETEAHYRQVTSQPKMATSDDQERSVRPVAVRNTGN